MKHTFKIYLKTKAIVLKHWLVGTLVYVLTKKLKYVAILLNKNLLCGFSHFIVNWSGDFFCFDHQATT
jgi:hypothetical protein